MADARTVSLPLAAAGDASAHPWARVFTLGTDGLAARAFPGATAVTFDDLGLPACLRLRADEATERAAGLAGGPGHTLLVTSLDLTLPDIDWVLGWANRRCRAAVVSAARLRDPADDERSLRRLLNVAAHESGHLRGLSHCRDEGCVMRSASGPEILDRRGDEPCAACGKVLRRRETWSRRFGRWLPARVNP